MTRRTVKKCLPHYLFVAILALAFAVRLRVLTQVFQGGTTWFFGTDPYYHIRRIFLALAHYPHVPIFDSYVNFPTGAPVNWPPGFDFLLATFSLILGAGSPSELLVERVSALSVPLLGTLTVGCLYFISRHYLPRGLALFATLMLALNGAHILYSRVGRVDHHVLEVTFPALAFLTYLAGSRRRTPTWRWAGLHLTAGVFLGLGLTAWTGSVMFIGIFLLYIFVEMGCRVSGRSLPRGFFRGAQLTLAAATLVLLPLCATTPWGRDGKVLYVALSWFHFLVPFYGFLVVTGLGLLWPAFSGRRFALGWFLLLGLVQALLLLGLTVLAQPETLTTLKDAAEFLVTKEAQINTVSESQPLYALKASLRDILYGPLVWFLPVVTAFALARPAWQRNWRPQDTFLMVWFLLTGTLAVLQIRFTPAFSLPLCIYWGLLLRDLHTLLRRRGEARQKRGLYGWLVVPVYLVLVLASLGTAMAQPDQKVYPRLLAFFREIREITPETSYFLSPDRKPEYGILSHWNWGHHLNYLSHRPNIANPFGQVEWYLKGVRASYAFLMEEEEAAAVSLADKVEARYILVAPMGRSLTTHANMLTQIHPEKQLQGSARSYIEAHYRCLMNNRMLLYDGLAPAETEGISPACLCPLKHFRLTAESAFQSTDKITGARTSFFKLFERVQSARLTGTALPETVVDLQVAVTTNRDRTFTYARQLRTDSQGRFETFLPYATQGTSTPCRPAGPYRVSSGGKSVFLQVSEHAVRSGETVSVDLAGP